MNESTLKSQIDQLEDRLEQHIAFGTTERMSAAIRERKLRLAVTPILEIAVCFLLLSALGDFASKHWAALIAQPIRLVPSFAIGICLILAAHLAGQQLYAISQVAHDASVFETQTRLEKLHIQTSRQTQLMLCLGMTAWVFGPLLIAQLSGILDVFNGPLSLWIVSNIAFGILASIAICALAQRSRWARHIQDTFAGSEIAEARRFIASLQAE